MVFGVAVVALGLDARAGVVVAVAVASEAGGVVVGCSAYAFVAVGLALGFVVVYEVVDVVEVA